MFDIRGAASMDADGPSGVLSDVTEALCRVDVLVGNQNAKVPVTTLSVNANAVQFECASNLADQLTRAGIAVLRYDDRGVGKSTGNFSTATHLDFAADGRAAFEYLKSRPEINSKKVGLLGHSEGSVYVPFVTRESKGVAFVVMLAGVGVPIRELLARQARDIASASGMKYEKTPALEAIDDEIYARLATGKSDAESLNFVRGKVKEAMALYPEDLKKAMGLSDATLEGLVRMFVSPWFMRLSESRNFQSAPTESGVR